MLFGVTRAGYLLAYDTAAAVHARLLAALPPRQRELGRLQPGRGAAGQAVPARAVGGSSITFKAPGDDLICGTVDHYEVVQSNGTITASNFSSQEPRAGRLRPTAPGTTQSMQVPPERPALRRGARRGRAGQRGPAGGYRGRELRPAAGATPLRVSLVPAFRPCTSPNRSHGPALSFASCAPPEQVSPELTVGSPDANGKVASSNGVARLDVVLGNPATPADEADVQVALSITDVRRRGDLSDYTGELQLTPVVRITDRLNGPTETEPATVEDTFLPVTVPCAATAGDVGATCAVTTTFDAVTPGAVPEGKRANWALDCWR